MGNIFYNNIVNNKNKMKVTASITALLVSSCAAFGSFGKKAAPAKALKGPLIDTLPGALEPVGFFDPWGLAEKANDATIKRYREAELTHGRVAMLAVIGFFVGEKVEGSSFLFDAQISGPAITHFSQVPEGFWPLTIAFIGTAELYRAQQGWIDPADLPIDNVGQLKDDYIPGDLNFDPLGIKPEDPEEFFEMQTKELQHGRLAMLAAAGFLAQEATDGKGIIEHFQS